MEFNNYCHGRGVCYNVVGGTVMSFLRSALRKDSSEERRVRQKPREAGMRG